MLTRIFMLGLVAALPAFADETLPPVGETLPPAGEALPPAGSAPVDEVPAISTTAPASEASSAAMECSFDTECIDAECAASSYGGTLTVMTDGAGLATASWADPSETIAMAAMIREGTVFATSDGADGRARILTALADGSARFATHLSDPILSISYIGSCEKDG